MATNLGYMPARIVAGETIWIAAANTTQAAQDIVLPLHTPASFTLAYQFAAATPITVNASANNANTGWTLEVAEASTLLWKAGTISFAAYATETAGTARKFAVDEGVIAVTASPLAVSQYAAALTACEAAIADYAANPNGSFTLGDMSVSYRSLSQLIDLRNYLKAQVNLQTGKRIKRIIRTRFT